MSEIVVRVVLALFVEGGSESTGSVEVIAVVVAELVVEVLSARFGLGVMVVGSPMGFVSLEEVEGEEVSAELGVAGCVIVGTEIESLQSVDAGLVVVVAKTVELVRGSAEEPREEEEVIGVSGAMV